jgi:16S rRNA (cytidine1402-2'-O)-methyltransferase
MLYIVGTPIGNLKDISLRALDTLKSVDIIFAEDTRRIRNLLDHYDILKKAVISYNEHNKTSKNSLILQYLSDNKDVALVSDAGMPVISDPGIDIIDLARENGFEITTIPGPTAFVSAIILSGFKFTKFTFFGFLPRDKKRRRLLRSLIDEEGLLIFYDSPYRIKKTLTDIFNIFGNVECAIVKEITKIHENVLKGRTEDLIEMVDDFKGELVLIIKK